MLTSYTVFNVKQRVGLKLPEILQTSDLNECEADQACEDLVNGWENRPALQLLSQTECRAYYRPATDSVHMLARFRFAETALYYSTLCHKLVHSTGHESTVNRTFGPASEATCTAGKTGGPQNIRFNRVHCGHTKNPEIRPPWPGNGANGSG